MATYSEQELAQALKRCEAEPLRHIGRIQSHGALLVLDADEGRTVLQTSENIREFLNVGPADVIGKPLATLLERSAIVQFERLCKDAAKGSPATADIGIKRSNDTVSVVMRVFFASDSLVLELIDERAATAAPHFGDLLKSMEQAELRSNDDAQIGRYFERVTAIVRETSGFDRVMAYRFDRDWDGEVIAESRVDSAQSYLGNRFPGGDIPPQARLLYTINLVRQVADIDTPTFPILPALNPASGQPLDLALTSLRALSPVHLEYLGNMGVRASLSISLLQNGRLWGLIACHHMAPLQVSTAVQEAGAFISRLASAKLSTIETLRQRSLSSESIRIVGELLKYISRDRDGSVLTRLLPELMKLFDATGIVTVIDGKQYVAGKVPAEEALADLLGWLGGNPAAESFACDNLGERFPGAAKVADTVAGLLASPLTPDMRNCIVWLRAKKIQTSIWAGNPEKTMSQDAAGAWRISPRKSFSVWSETWRGRSMAWSNEEAGTAVMLANALTEGFAQKVQLEHFEAHLREAQKMEAIGTLAGGIAHDFNNALAIIAGNLTLAREDIGEQHPANMSLDEIAKATERSRALVAQILMFSRRQALELTAQNLAPLLQEGVRLLRATIPASVQWELSLGALPVYVRCNPSQISQILINLCTNAYHAMANGKGRIALSLDEVQFGAAEMLHGNPLQTGRYARISVRDDGHGMDAATQARVFAPFFSTNPIGTGTGLGLSVVHGIVKSHHGAIRLASTQGAGSTFEVLLPLVDAPEQQGGSAPVVLAPVPAPAPARSLHVLFLDDEAALLLMMERVLTRLGYTVSTFDVAEHALAAVRDESKKFDLLLTDYNMPRASGLDVARAVAQIRPDLPVVIISGLVTDELLTSAREIGVRDVIEKASSVIELANAIGLILERLER